MFNNGNNKMDQHYAALSSDILHALRAEYKWASEECNMNAATQLEYIEKILTLRGESLAVRTERRILFLCKCGQSRIVDVALPENQLKMFIFDQYNIPCTKCKNVNAYSWKFMN